MYQPKTLKQKVQNRVTRTKKTDVFLPRDFADLSGEDQVLRALRSLVHDGALLRLGYGVYARATRSRLSGRLMVASSNGFHSAALQALDKLGIPWEQSDSTRAYNEGGRRKSWRTRLSRSRHASTGGYPMAALRVER
ncbi:conjugative transfer positive regulator protein (plasmid) [Rhizobium grahamii CCGE 502]|uniref:Conjugative transfer positive regulator protein n=2 Tax=Rhizobium grahamii TaxID=1120045 RepID=S3I264_9HYPH|nr:conjugative transfer positive regulator protein [Rhizobium grahamii CCGE 502]